MSCFFPNCYFFGFDFQVSVLCHHTFHCACLMRWREHSTCPVCRYSQTPPAHDADAQCSVCALHHSLWMCLICGQVGCGRYTDGQHAHVHFLQTQHAFALELETQRVWDYAGDGYVHRLVQNKSDGKLVQAGSGFGGGAGGKGDKNAQHEAELLWLEYEYLLKSQLETQRTHYESQLAAARAEAEQLLSAAGNARDQLAAALARQEKERRTLEKQLARVTARLQKLEADADFTTQLNSSLEANQKQWAERVRSAEAAAQATSSATEARVKELEEQVRDLMFFIEAQKKLESQTSADEREVCQLLLLGGERLNKFLSFVCVHEEFVPACVYFVL